MKEQNYQYKLDIYLNRPKRDKKYSQKEIIMDFLSSNPNNWYYIWELMGEKPLGWISHKVDCGLSILNRQGLVDIKYINKYAVYSSK